MDPGFGLTVLLVEDHTDIREALASILESEGYEVHAVHSAEAGMSRLCEYQFHLLITDYCLPVKTGTWLIEEARSTGMLGSTKVLMITAHPQPHVPESVQVMRKPLDVDDFVNEVARLLAKDRQEVLERYQASTSAPAEAASSARRVELVLYISSASHSSLRALRNVRKLLDRYDPAEVGLTVHDLSKSVVKEAEEDRIAFTPTLVRRQPAPRAWVLGDLANPEVVADLLSLAGVEEKR